MKRVEDREERHRGDRRLRQPDDDGGQDAELAAAVDARRVEVLLRDRQEELAQEEDRERVPEPDRDDQRPERADEAELRPHHVERHDRHLRRQHQRDEHDHEDGVAAAPAQARERVGDRDARDDDAERRQARVDHRVQRPLQQRRLVEDLGEVAPLEGLRPELRRERLVDVISAVSVMKTTGARNASAAAIRRLCSATETRKRRRRTARGGFRRTKGVGDRAAHRTAPGVVHPAPRVPHDHERHRERDHEQQHRHRRGVAHVEEAEAVVVEEDGIEERRALRVALLERADRARLRRLACCDRGRDVRLREVLERLDHAQHDREEDHRADRRQRHPAQPLEGARAVELGGLVQVLRHVEDRRQEDDHDVADAPEREQRQRRLRPLGRVEPERPLDAELLEDRC